MNTDQDRCTCDRTQFGWVRDERCPRHGAMARELRRSEKQFLERNGYKEER